jgi:hypothetical protein
MSRFSGPTPSNAPRNDVAPPQKHYVPRHKTTGTLIVNMVRDVMILIGANPFRGPLEGVVCPENRDFLGH